MITLTKELLLKLMYQNEWQADIVSRIELNKTYWYDGTIKYRLYANDSSVEITKDEYETLESQLEKEFYKEGNDLI